MHTYDRERDKERYAQADRVNLMDYIQRSGYDLKREGHEYRIPGYSGLLVNPDKNCFRWYSEMSNTGKKVAGGPVQFLMYVENRSRNEAIDQLIGRDYATITDRPQATAQEPRPFIMPERNGDYRRLFAYLTKTRGIDSGIVQEGIRRGLLYESADRHNCVFVAYDEQGIPAGAFQRGTVTDKPFKGEISGTDKSCPFCWEGTSNRVYIYEGAIDMFSDLSLEKMRGSYRPEHHRVVLGGVYDAPLLRYLDGHPNINAAVFRTDNDKAGQQAARQIGGGLLVRGITVKASFPVGKDVNQDLTDYRAQQANRMEVDEHEP